MRTPLFGWLQHRAAGVLLHPTCLPGDFGVGTLDAEAYRFLQFLARSGFSYWQMCPLGPTGFGDSPYQCFSAFAGNPYLINLLEVSRAGLLPAENLGPLVFLNSDRVDYGALYKLKRPILHNLLAAHRRHPGHPLPYGDFELFKKQHRGWLDDYAFFQALKDHFQGKPWWEWPAGIRDYRQAGNSPLRQELADRVESERFLQYLFFGQWKRLRTRAHELGISIIGDIPLFVALDSADVWSHPHLFQLDRKFQPKALAGVPPDYFSEDGQLWGNPLYDWKAHQEEDYAWWHARLAANFELYDVVRIDHFRGFDAYWSVPFGSATARQGKWEPGPGLSFFESVQSKFPEARLIAEDLGTLGPSVTRLLKETGLPGMAVLQFAFGGGADNFYLPHNLEPNSLIYPGTHDNDTTQGWYQSVDEPVRDHVRRYFRVSGQEISWDFIRAAYSSVSRLAIIPLQDLMNLGSEARFNRPGQGEGNWDWRFRPAQLNQVEEQSSGYLKELASLYGRLPTPAPRP